jgi:hypothetical protein
MKKPLLYSWCLLPLALAAYHYGPGQAQLVLDEAGRSLAEGRERAAEAAELEADGARDEAVLVWARAEEAFTDALRALPAGRVAERRRLLLERAKCRMFVSRLPEANAELAALVRELEADSAADAELLRDARRTLANSEYCMTWLLRLEGAGREDWEPRIESARQNLRLLAEDDGTSDVRGVQEDLEATVRLARMDLTELQGLPLPRQ